MKKTVLYIIMTIFITILMCNTAMAFTAPIIPKPSYIPGPDTSQQMSGDKFTGRLTLTETLIPNYTVALIATVGTLSFLFLVIAGVKFATAYGDTEAIGKAKTQVIYALVGFLLSLLAYTIVTIVINLKFVNK